MRAGQTRCLAAGSWFKPRVTVCILPSERLVLKDFRSNPAWIRGSMGRWAIRHEARVLDSLAAVAGVPRFLGLLDQDGLVMQYVDGDRLGDPGTHELAEQFFDDLERIVKEVHAAGWAHGDLANRRNILRDREGSPWLVDFGAALRLGRGRNWLRRIDRWGLLKNKARYQQIGLTKVEAEDLARRAIWRRLWPFGWFRRRGRSRAARARSRRGAAAAREGARTS